MFKNGLTPATIAEKLNVDPKTVERWLTQDRTPYARHRHALAGLFRENESYFWPDAVSPQRAALVAQSELVQVYPRRVGVPADLWTRLIDNAQERIGILAYAGLFLVEQQPKLIQVLQEKAEAGVRVEILVGDPDAEQIERRSTEEGAAGVMTAKIHNVMQYYGKLRGVPGVTVGYHHTTLYNSIYRFDSEMLVNTHVYGFPAPHTPVMHLRRLSGGDLFDTYADSFDRVMSTSRSPWPANLEV